MGKFAFNKFRMSLSKSPVIEIYCTRSCRYCQHARTFFKQRGYYYLEYLVDIEPELRIEMEQRTNHSSVPQILIDDFHIGGYDSLVEFAKNGRLNLLL